MEERCYFVLFVSFYLTLLIISQEFIYPEGIAYPVGGSGGEQFLVLEMHYDNPGGVSGKKVAKIQNK